MTTIPGTALQMPEGNTPEARRASLMSLPPAERLATFRRFELDDGQPWAPVPARSATEDEMQQLRRLPPVERLAEARRLGIG